MCTKVVLMQIQSVVMFTSCCFTHGKLYGHIGHHGANHRWWLSQGPTMRRGACLLQAADGRRRGLFCWELGRHLQAQDLDRGITLVLADKPRDVPRDLPWFSRTSVAVLSRLVDTHTDTLDAHELTMGSTKGCQKALYLHFRGTYDFLGLFQRRFASFGFVDPASLASRGVERLPDLAKKFPLLGWTTLKAWTNAWATGVRLHHESVNCPFCRGHKLDHLVHLVHCDALHRFASGHSCFSHVLTSPSLISTFGLSTPMSTSEFATRALWLELVAFTRNARYRTPSTSIEGTMTARLREMLRKYPPLGPIMV